MYEKHFPDGTFVTMDSKYDYFTESKRAAVVTRYECTIYEVWFYTNGLTHMASYWGSYEDCVSMGLNWASMA